MGGQDGQGCRLPRQQGEDLRWHYQGQAHQEQKWQDRFQGRFSPWQEELRQQRYQGLGRCCQGSPQGPEPHWLCCRWRQVGNRQGALCQGQGPAQVNGDVREALLPILGFKGSAPPNPSYPWPEGGWGSSTHGWWS